MTDRRYYGKYRGTVINNVDPMFKGRIMAQVPDVLGATPSGWAMPCFPFAGPQMGAVALPMIGAGVWVEFEGGDPSKPIWVGGFYGTPAEVPALANAAPPGVSSVVVQTLGQNTLMLSDVPGPTGGVLLKTTTGATLTMNDTGITFNNGKGAIIAMVGNVVTVNGGALTVT